MIMNVIIMSRMEECDLKIKLKLSHLGKNKLSDVLLKVNMLDRRPLVHV